MEYISGLPLDRVCENSGGRLGQAEVVPIGLQLLDALAAIHAQGLLHRDVKPANVYLADDGAVKLIDFGAARFSTGHATQMLSQIFTPGFAPIEQYQERSRQGPSTDLYAVGATLYFLLTGGLPPDATARAAGAPLLPAHQVPGSDASQALAWVLDRALQLSPSARWASALEMQAALRAAVTPGPRFAFPAHPVAGSAMRPSAVAPGRRLPPTGVHAARNKGLIIAGGALVSTWFLYSLVSGIRDADEPCRDGEVRENGVCVDPAGRDPDDRDPDDDCPPGTRLSGKRCVPAAKPTASARPIRPPPTVSPRPVTPPPLPPDIRPEFLGSCPTGMVRIPGGSFVMGETKEAVTVGDYCMDRTEVTVEAFRRCKEQGPCADVVLDTKYGCNFGIVGKDQHPINCVDWSSAATFCAAVGKRLPKEPEWEWAARGGAEGRKFPWGERTPEPGDVCKPPGNCAVGSHPAGQTLHGLLDMAGNVAEWVDAERRGERVYRGGDTLDSYYFYMTSVRDATPGIARLFTLGFRCAK
jgi:hypothetical protein